MVIPRISVFLASPKLYISHASLIQGLTSVSCIEPTPPGNSPDDHLLDEGNTLFLCSLLTTLDSRWAWLPPRHPVLCRQLGDLQLSQPCHSPPRVGIRPHGLKTQSRTPAPTSDANAPGYPSCCLTWLQIGGSNDPCLAFHNLL